MITSEPQIFTYYVRYEMSGQWLTIAGTDNLVLAELIYSQFEQAELYKYDNPNHPLKEKWIQGK